MSDSCFINTNVLVYCYTQDEPDKQQKALKIANNPDMFISTQVLTELSNTLKKKFKLEWQVVKDVVSEVSSDFNIYVNKPIT